MEKAQVHINTHHLFLGRIYGTPPTAFSPLLSLEYDSLLSGMTAVTLLFYHKALSLSI